MTGREMGRQTSLAQSGLKQEEVISLVSNGTCAKDGNRAFHTSSFAAFLEGLTREYDAVRYLGPYLTPEDPGFNYSHERELSLPGLELHLYRGNATDTKTWPFVRNYLVALWRLARFVTGGDRFMVFLPSFLTVVAAVWVLALRKELGVYIGGNWGAESKHRRRGPVQTLFYPINRFVVDPLVKWIARRASFAITPGYDLYAELQRQGCKVRLPVPLVMITPDDVFARVDTCVGSEVRILFVGALRHQKGVRDLLEAFACVSSDNRLGKRLRLWFVGTGDAEAELRDEAKVLGIQEDVVLFGHVTNGPELYKLYRQADVFAMPSYSEGFPRTLYEAMAFALPIVTTKVGGIPYLLEHGTTAYLVEPGDQAALVEALRTVITDAGLRAQLIRKARELILSNVFRRIEQEGSLARQVRRQFSRVAERPLEGACP